MKPQDLIAILQNMDPELDVMFVYDYGDRCHTRVAVPVSDVVSGFAEYSSYHSMEMVAEDEESDSTRPVIFLE
jgi:hypothetical protein